MNSRPRLTRLATDVVRSITNDTASPRWNPGDFFGTRFGQDTDKRVR